MDIDGIMSSGPEVEEEDVIWDSDGDFPSDLSALVLSTDSASRGRSAGRSGTTHDSPRTALFWVAWEDITATTARFQLKAM